MSFMRISGILFLIAVFLAPNVAYAGTVDASIEQSGITFSTTTFYVGDTVRVYALIRNVGETDMIATVFFYHSATLIGAAQPISLRSGGAAEEVFVDFVVPRGSFNIRAVIQGSEPTDENAANNEATTPLYTSIVDDDGDRVADDEDNCTDTVNATQTDTDGDGVGDACDVDDDGDALSDAEESTAGTDALDADTDDDGVDDSVDDAPTDARASVEEGEATGGEGVTDALSSGRVVEGDGSDDEAEESMVDQSFGGSFDVESDAGMKSEGEGEDVGEVEVQNEWPTKAWGIFSGMDGDANDAASPNENRSFFQTDNPWLFALIGVFGFLMLLALLVVVLLRRRDIERRDAHDL